MPASPVWNTDSSCRNWSLRAASDDATARDVEASRVRNSLCARATVATFTPLPKKPEPLNCPPSVSSSAFWRE